MPTFAAAPPSGASVAIATTCGLTLALAASSEPPEQDRPAALPVRGQAAGPTKGTVPR
jgi:hypothetical protein